MTLSKLIRAISIGSAALCASATFCYAAEAPLPVAIAPYFTPPAAYAEKFGDFRSPLQFDDGTIVKAAAEWPRRREEIANYWTGIMGPWPQLLTRGAF